VLNAGGWSKLETANEICWTAEQDVSMNEEYKGYLESLENRTEFTRWSKWLQIKSSLAYVRILWRYGATRTILPPFFFNWFADSWTVKDGNLCKADGNVKYTIKPLHVTGNFRYYSILKFMGFVILLLLWHIKLNMNLKYCNPLSFDR
jgi:hypothetical protein